MTRPSESVLTPYQSSSGAFVFQFALSLQFAPPVASYNATSAARSVATVPCAKASAARPAYMAATASTGNAPRRFRNAVSADVIHPSVGAPGILGAHPDL